MPSFTPHFSFFCDANIEISHGQMCYEGIGSHQPATEATNYAAIFGQFLGQNDLALLCIYSRCHQGQRHTYKTSLPSGGPRRLDYIAVPSTWRAATTKVLLLEHFDAYTVIYDHKSVAVEIEGSIVSQEVISKISRSDKRWIANMGSQRTPASNGLSDSAIGATLEPEPT